MMNEILEKSKKIELNSIICCDCVEGMKQLKDNFIDLIVTSPPYDNIRNYNSYKFSFEKIAQQLYRITKKGGVVVWVVGDRINNGNRTLTSFQHALYFHLRNNAIHEL